MHVIVIQQLIFLMKIQPHEGGLQPKLKFSEKSFILDFFFYCYFRLLFLDVRIAAAPVQVMVMMVDMRWRHCAVVMTDIWWNH